MIEDLNWLNEVVAEMKRTETTVLSDPELKLLGYTDVDELCPAVRVYLTSLTARGVGCTVGNFEFWSPQRLRSKGDSPQSYGGDASLLLIADWMLDSELCAVDTTTGLMVFLGGENPIYSSLSLVEFVERVASDPTTPHGMV